MDPDVNDSICNKLLVKIKNKIQFFGDESSLHGVGYVLSMSPIPFFRRLFWLIILSCCCFGASVILRGALSLYSGDVVSYSVETNYLNFDTAFPAVTLCEQMDSGERIKPYLVKNSLPLGLNAFLKENVYYNFKYCRTCESCKINTTCVENFIDLVNGIRLNCSGFLTDCWWDGKPFKCCDRCVQCARMGESHLDANALRMPLVEATYGIVFIRRFHPIPTEYGICFVFNSLLVGNNDSSILTVNQKVGLPTLIFTAVQNVQLRIHSPGDMVSVAMENILGIRSSLPLVTDFELTLKAEQIISDLSVTSLTRSQRGCLFAHEHPAQAHLWPFTRYSYSACLMYCKAWTQVQLCNCTHHFLPILGNHPICDIRGLGCLYNNKDTLTRDLKCECPMGCEEIYYKVIHIRNFRHIDNVPKELVKRGTRASLRLAQLPTLRVLRHAIRDTLGLVVDIGGVGGVFFGASLLSVIEIIYLFCIRRGP